MRRGLWIERPIAVPMRNDAQGVILGNQTRVEDGRGEHVATLYNDTTSKESEALRDFFRRNGLA